MPVWIAGTDANRRDAERVWTTNRNAVQTEYTSHTERGDLTTFVVNPNATPEDWFLGIFEMVAMHHDVYSHTPGYSAVEVFGVAPTPRIEALLAEYRLTRVTPSGYGFTACTVDGSPAGSPNVDDADD